MSREWQITLYSEVPVDPEWLKIEHSYQIRSVPAWKLPRRLRDVVLFLILMGDHLKNRFQVVHAHSTYPAGLIAVVFQMIFRVPALVSLDSAEGSALPEIRFGDLLSAKRRKLNRWVIQRACAVTALTEFQRNEVERNLGINRTIYVLPRGIDLAMFFPKSLKERSTPFILLSVGYINPIKDPETLLHAFRDILKEIDSQLIVVGKDYTDGAAERLAAELGLGGKIRFEGYVDHTSMPDYYRQAHVLIHTALYESQAIVVAEAMASGLPVVGTKVGLISDLGSEYCIATEPGDAQALAQAVLALIRDDQAMARLRKNALDWSQRHSLVVTCDKLMSIYQQLGQPA